MTESKQDFRFITEIPKNTYGEHFDDLFVYPDYDAGRVCLQITIPANCEKIVWEVLDQNKVIAAGAAAAPPAGELFMTGEKIPAFKP